jgi:hypothetical protein
VRDRDWIFLTALDDVKELKPEDTALVHDDSPHYRRTRLYLEALLRRSPATDDGLYVGHRGAIERTTYQQQPAAKALGQLRPRILMADGVGLWSPQPAQRLSETTSIPTRRGQLLNTRCAMRIRAPS